MNVLLVDDEHNVAELMLTSFESAGISLHHEMDGLRGLNTALNQPFDAIVLDLNLPLMDGFKVLSEIRRHKLTTPVIILSARTELDARMTAFELGANDYLPKPFFIEELIVRLKILVDRTARNLQNTVEVSGLTLDRLTRTATWRGNSAKLTQREFELLDYLMLSPGKILTRQMILQRVWGFDFNPGTNVLEVCMQRLRKKLTGDTPIIDKYFPIESIRSVGYRMNKD
jgi:DNA-binding response OmpR family regulator